MPVSLLPSLPGATGRPSLIESKELMQLMDNTPYKFCMDAGSNSLKRLSSFKHRTFNADDRINFIEFFRQHYSKHSSLETAFFSRKGMTVEEGLNHFKTYFFSLEHLKRTEKHISSPAQKSTCKRLNMYLRWMVRKDSRGVDFGIWNKIAPAQLICPLDVHVARVARKLGLLHRKQNDWQAATELTEYLRTLDQKDPVKYDFALFSLGIDKKY